MGRLIGASHMVGGIVRFDWQSPNAAPETVVNGYGGSRFGSPNDLTVRDDGVLYFTDPFYQAGAERQDEERAYWVDTAGTVSPIDGAPTPPNGISLSPDQQTLYIGGGQPLRAFPVGSDGAPGTGAQFGDTPYRGVDGMGVDCAGNLYVTLHSDGVVAVLSPSGDRIGTITVASSVTNVAFGGPDRKTLFITKLNPPTLYSVNVGIAGYPY
jgi:gluconolactonase